MSQAEVNATDTDPTQESAEGNNAQEPSLDTLLKEYEETPKEEPKQEPPKSVAQPAADTGTQEWIERQMLKEQNDAIHNSAKVLRETVGDTHLSERWFEGQLHVEANEDPRILKAFKSRETNPAAWKEILTSLGKKIAKDLSANDRVDEQATESWNAVETSMHSASTSKGAAPELDWSSLSDQEFAAAKMKLIRKGR